LTEPIADEDALLRRVKDHPGKLWILEQDGTKRPTSGAMKPAASDDGLSVDVRRLLEDPADPLSSLAGDSDAGLVEFRANVPRLLGLDVEHAPTAVNPAHANVVGLEHLSRSKSQRARKTLAERAVWVKEPASADTPP
jgi:hypothetical protein